MRRSQAEIEGGNSPISTLGFPGKPQQGGNVSEASDFDFLPGEWNVHNRRLRERLAGSEEWEEFEATSVARHILGGCGNEDEFRTDYDGGFVGMSFRFFDPTSRQWSIYWADSRRPGVLDPPLLAPSRATSASSMETTRSRAGRSAFASSGPA